MKVTAARPYVPLNLGSKGNAKYMYLSQYQFPDTFDERDKIIYVDSDRMDFDHLWECFGKHAKIASNIGEWKFEEWVLEATDEAIFAFLRDVFESKDVKWTGYRLRGSVGYNGKPIWHFALFYKCPDSSTIVYTGPEAPNVIA